MAQSNVYSLNVVGYVNVNLTSNAPTRLTLVANQLDLDGTGTNNTIYTFLGTNLPAQTAAFGMNPGVGNFSKSTYNGSGTWFPIPAAVTAACQPGRGVVVQLPAGSSDQTLTEVGTVLQGTFSQSVVTGLQMGSIDTPQNIGIKAAGYNGVTNASGNDKVFTWNRGSQSYTSHTFNGATWFPGTAGDVIIPVGDSFVFSSVAGKTWTQTFTVPQ